MANLVSYVHVRDEQGQAFVFGPGDKVPDWAVKRIINPKAWEGGKAPTASTASTTSGEGSQPKAKRTRES